jgi:hypothetical protein
MCGSTGTASSRSGRTLGRDSAVRRRRLLGRTGFVDLHTHLREPGQEWKERPRLRRDAAAAAGASPRSWRCRTRTRRSTRATWRLTCVAPTGSRWSRPAASLSAARAAAGPSRRSVGGGRPDLHRRRGHGGRRRIVAAGDGVSGPTGRSGRPARRRSGPVSRRAHARGVGVLPARDRWTPGGGRGSRDRPRPAAWSRSPAAGITSSTCRRPGRSR